MVLLKIYFYAISSNIPVLLGNKSGKDAKTPGGGLPYESDGDAHRKIEINTLKETNLGVAPALFNL